MGQIVLQLDETGATTHRYLWGPAVDQILADEVVDDGGAEDVNWTLTDQQNSVRDIVEYDPVTGEAEVVNHFTYDSYGNANAAVDCLFGFTGRLFDESTGLQNNLNRWYDPEVGRWLSEDPIGFEGGDANLYRYVGNDPGNNTDSRGLFPPLAGLHLQEGKFTPPEPQTSPSEALDSFQTELDVAGLCPAAGIIPDAINTAISVVRAIFEDAAHWENAKWNAAAIVPVAGQFATGSKLAGKIAKATSKVVDVANNFATKYGKYVCKVDHFKHALSLSHIKAAKIEQAGGIVAEKASGVPFNHLRESFEAMKGARKRIQQLKKYLSDPNLTPAQRRAIESELSELSNMLDRAEDFLGQ